VGLLDRFVAAGRALFAEPSPRELQTPVAVPNPWQSRDAAMLGNSLTPARLTQILYERNQGYLQQWVDLADEAREKDPHMHSQLAIREQSVVETEFVVQPGQGSNQRAAKRAADACTRLYQHWQSQRDPSGLVPQGLERWLAEFVGGNYHGRSGHEVLWDDAIGEIAPTGLDLIDTRRFGYACDQGVANPWELRIWDPDVMQSPFSGYFGTPVSELPREKLLLSEPRIRGAQRSREGLFSTIVWYYLFRIWSWRDVMALAEMLGRPPIIGYYAAGGARGNKENQFDGARNASDRDVTALKKTVSAVTGALRASLPDTVRVEALKYEMPTSEPMQLMISREIDAFESKAINGVANLSDLKAGARAAVEAQERTSYTFWRADCRMAARLLTTLFGYYVRANPTRFGVNCPIPVAVPQIQPPKDLVKAGERIEKARTIGLNISRKWAHDELEIPEPKEGEEVLEAPAPPPTAKPADDDEDERESPDEEPDETPEATE
jgi:phage gp29-like protein